MKYIQFILFIVFPAFLMSSAQAQQLSINAVSEHAGYSRDQFPMEGGVLESDRGYITIGEEGVNRPAAWAISHSGQKAVFLKETGGSLRILQLGATGYKYMDRELEFFDPADETLAIYSFDDGRAVTRDNVTNFTFFDPKGEILYSVGNSAQSRGGQRESEFASDPLGTTVVLYNPVISYDNSRGSQARLVYGEEDHKIFYSDRSAEIVELKVTKNGSYITILTTNGSQYNLHIYDRFGNKLNRFDFDDQQTGASLSGNGEYLTVYSGGRVQVLNALSGERIGSTSSRSPVLYAAYQPEDDLILSLGGNLQGDRVTDPMITAVHIGRRQIVREEIGQSLSLLDRSRLEIIRLQGFQYRMDGMNRSLTVGASF